MQHARASGVFMRLPCATGDVMPTRYYVTAQRPDRSTKRLCGPFNDMREATAMVEPIRAAVAGDPEYRNAGFKVESVLISAKRIKEGARFKRGAIDPARISLDDVIEAARRHKGIWYDR